MNHVMLDIETLGHKSHSVILSIGAVQFDPFTGEVGEKFHCKVDLQSSLNQGLKVTASTLLWWMQQSQQARDGVFAKEIGGTPMAPLHEALQALSEFFTKVRLLEISRGQAKPRIYTWGKSPRFDQGILEDAYDACGMPIPWDFRDERDVRTLEYLTDFAKSFDLLGPRPTHDALQDCLDQVQMCHKCHLALLGRALELANPEPEIQK